VQKNSPIVLIADEVYLPYIPANLYQISLYAPKRQVVYLVSNFALADGEIESLKTRFADLVLIYKIVDLNDYFGDFLPPKGSHVSKVALLKFFLPSILRDEDCVLYLDIDTLICEPLNNLLSFQPRLAIAATEELGVNAFHREDSPSYFNSGVLIISLAKLRELNIEDKARDMALGGQFTRKYVDQEIFNILLGDSVEYLPQKYNVFICNIKFKNLGNFIESPSIVHFVGIDKPWTYPMKSKYSKLWRESLLKGVGKYPNTEQRRVLNSKRGLFNTRKMFHLPSLVLSRILMTIRSIVPNQIKAFLREFI
jgi:lipopolysaccharide biosynthesis glycosyltransferase